MSVSYLIYTSTANHFLPLVELEALWAQAKGNNNKNQITGLLLYQEGIFMQMLEGELDSILSLYKTIQQDPRHVCEQQPITGSLSKRYFPDWSMGFKEIQQGHNLPSLQIFLSYIDSLFVLYDKEKIDEILNFIISYSQWSDVKV